MLMAFASRIAAVGRQLDHAERRNGCPPRRLLLSVWATNTVPQLINAPRFDRGWCVEGKPTDNIVVWLDDQTDMFSQRQRAVHGHYQSCTHRRPTCPSAGGWFCW
jgi:hypothetical protein